MDRRTVIVMLAGVLLAETYDNADAQQAAKMWRIGILSATSFTDPSAARIYEAFFQTLQERGYIEGKNLVVDRRSADGENDRYPVLAAELVRLKPDVIVSVSTPGIRSAKGATSSIPIVMAGVGDPVAGGLVTSLAHPGGNITGIANMQVDLYSKRIELLKSVVPKITRIVSIDNTGNLPADLAAQRKEQDAEAKAIGMNLVRVELRAPADWRSVTEAIVRERPDALVLFPVPINFNLRREIAEFAKVQRLPVIGANRDQAVAGILMSYGPDIDDVWRLAAVYVDKILKGAKPADLPIEQPTKFELVINLKTAKALGITIPQSVLLRADELIE
jgi:putative tryptophan/tyrosine transport system substrate-binding protein